MRKIAVLILALAMALVMLAAFPGCGEGDKAAAQEYMQKGDESIAEAESGYSAMEEKQNEIITMAMDNELEKLAGAEGQALTEDILELEEGIRDDLGKARTGYQAIEGLSGVEDYKSYAAIILEVISLSEELLDWGDKLAEKFEQALMEAAASGQAFDVMAFLTEGEEIARLTELGMEIEDLNKEADSLKRDKAL